MAAKTKELDRGGKWWAGLSEGQRIDVASVAQEVFTAGRSLRDVWDSAKLRARIFAKKTTQYTCACSILLLNRT
jgi:hypothetical protein